MTRHTDDEDEDDAPETTKPDRRPIGERIADLHPVSAIELQTYIDRHPPRTGTTSVESAARAALVHAEVDRLLERDALDEHTGWIRTSVQNAHLDRRRLEERRLEEEGSGGRPLPMRPPRPHRERVAERQAAEADYVCNLGSPSPRSPRTRTAAAAAAASKTVTRTAAAASSTSKTAARTVSRGPHTSAVTKRKVATARKVAAAPARKFVARTTKVSAEGQAAAREARRRAEAKARRDANQREVSGLTDIDQLFRANKQWRRLVAVDEGIRARLAIELWKLPAIAGEFSDVSTLEAFVHGMATGEITFRPDRD